MKNITTKEFCRKFLACKEGTRFALKYKRMSECYDALLNREAGRNSYQWAVWTYVRAVKKKERVRFSLWCANRVRHLMTDKRSTDALDAVQRWLNGERVNLKGFAEAANQAADASDPNASAAVYAACCASSAVYFVAFQVAYNAAAEAAYYAACFAYNAAAEAAYYAACFAYDADVYDHDAAEAAQIEHLRELGNPFEEEKK